MIVAVGAILLVCILFINVKNKLKNRIFQDVISVLYSIFFSEDEKPCEK